MSNTLLCLSDASSFLNKEQPHPLPVNKDILPTALHQDENHYVQVSTTAIVTKSASCPSKDTLQTNICHDENHYAQVSTNGIVTKSVSRKREASNVLLECVKRRDSLKESSNDVPCVGLSMKGEWDCKDDDASDSSVVDSGIESSSPVYSVETSSLSGLDEDIADNLMDVDVTEHPSPKPCNPSEVSTDAELSPQSVDTSTANDLNDLHLSDPLSGEEVVPKPALIQSVFNHVPSMIYFSTKDEVVSSVPDHILPTLKWKLSTITPAVVRQIVLKAGFSLLEPDTTEDWIGTWGKHLKCSAFKTLKHFQKVNHYPGGFHLGRKDRLWQNYHKMVGRHGNEAFDFFPDCFILPADLKALKEAWGDKSWILKPCASARGTGVKVIYKWSQVPKAKPNVVQRYISDPYLINGSKFDLRLYVLVSSFEPLRAYLFEDGLVRFASEKYSLANKSFANRFIHLTNYSINKKSSSYASNDDENICQGHKWSLKSFWTYMTESGIAIEPIQAKIKDLIIKTVLSAEGPICRLQKKHARTAYNSFELFGFDIMLDKDLHPWLLEVNISPSLHTKSMLDHNIKATVVKDMLNIAGFEVEVNSKSADLCRSKTVGNRHKPIRNRWLSSEEKKKHALYTFKHSESKSDILEHLTPDDLHCLVESEGEMHRRGNFTRIFPTESTGCYFPYFDHIRYYNVLLDAWEKEYHANREEGVKLLQELCEKTLQPQNNVDDSSEELRNNTMNGA